MLDCRRTVGFSSHLTLATPGMLNASGNLSIPLLPQQATTLSDARFIYSRH